MEIMRPGILLIFLLMRHSYADDRIDGIISALSDEFPLSNGVFEYAIKNVIDRNGLLKSNNNYVYIDWHHSKVFMKPENLEKDHNLCKMRIRRKILIIPIWKEPSTRDLKELVIANMKTKQFEYYPFSEQIDLSWKNNLRRFVRNRNKFVNSNKAIESGEWNLIPGTVILEAKFQPFNNAVAAMMVVDYKINGNFSFPKHDVYLYRCKLRKSIASSHKALVYSEKPWFKGCDEYEEGLKKLKKGTEEIKNAVRLLSDGGKISEYEINYVVTKIINPKNILSLGKKNVIYIKPSSAYQILNFPTQISQNQEFRRMSLSNKILIPLRDDEGDWTASCIHMNDKNVEYYDPTDPLLEVQSTMYDAETFLRKFLTAISKRNPIVTVKDEKFDTNFTKWKIKQPNIELQSQKKSFNYGINVIMFFDYKINGKFSFGSNVRQYRRSLWERVIVSYNKQS